MDLYSSALHSRNEGIELSYLGQSLIEYDRLSYNGWCDLLI
jgi:hypothetical protein